MRAACWSGKYDVDVNNVAEPKIVNPRDAIVRVTATTICGSDLHIYDGVIPSMRRGDIIGHEPVGEIVEVGPEVKDRKVGDRVVVCSVISCGQCSFCRSGQFSLCDNSNPNAWMLEKMYTYSPAGIFGYSHLFGGYAGAQAEYVRVPFADVGAFKLPDEVSDEQAINISDAWPTGYMAADLCNLQGGVTVVVWGAGPVGLFAMKSAWQLGAGRVVAIDSIPYRLTMAKEKCGAEVLDFSEAHISEALREMTAGRGPDCCIDACGMESHGTNMLAAAYDAVKQATRMEHDRGHVVRQMIECCRKGGTVVIMGVYAMVMDKFPLGAAFNKGLTFRMGQQHGQKYIPRLIESVRKGEVDPTFCLTHRFGLDEIERAYEVFANRQDNCVKVVIRP
jgi:threonine dehydrogenase-like Zn-dependent dehydrogenase